MFFDLELLEKMLINNFYCQTFSPTYSDISNKGYKLIEHAYGLLKHEDELYLSDAVSNLRKAYNYRLTDLFNNLGIDNLNFSLGKDRRLQKLEKLGLVKPLLLQKLIDIRNDIEYNFKTPSKPECEELADVVWYFYKSTDRLSNYIPYNWVIEWQEDGFECFIEFEIDFEKHRTIEFFGRFPQRYLSEQDNPRYIRLSNVEIRNHNDEDGSTDYNLYPFFCAAEIETKMMHNYIELLSYCLDKF